jgi:large subunit ribosomal protein L29
VGNPMILKVKDIRSWELETLRNKVTERRTALFSLKVQRFSTGIEKPHSIKVLKANIAKCNTILNEKREK